MIADRDEYSTLHKDQEQGAVLIFTAIFITAILLFLMMAVDGFFMCAFHVQQQNNAEYALLASLRNKVSGQAPNTTRANAIANQNHYVTQGNTDSNSLTISSSPQSCGYLLSMTPSDMKGTFTSLIGTSELSFETNVCGKVDYAGALTITR